ncbi:MAG: DNA polymerase III subunit beta [Patescibacteria group bacterium]|nr:DNA polymerase III subunit beta [Patescibacteria group bacterium]
MRISTTKEKILEAVVLSERLVGKKESLPVLSCVLLEVGKALTVRATNLEAAIEISIPGDGAERGVVAVPASILSQTLRSTLGERIDLKKEDGNLSVKSHGATSLIKSIQNEEFPVMGDDEESGGMINVPRESLMRCLQSVSYAASPSMIRPELGSVYVIVKDGGITCVATDSFRLAEKKISGSVSRKSETEILIPLKHVIELAHVLERIEDDSVDLRVGESQMSVKASGVRYTSRVVEGNFPDYNEIIPKSFVSEATVLKNDFSEILKKARVFSGSDQHVGIHIYPKKKILTATARSNDVGEMSDSIDSALSGEDLDINFHIGYLADCLPSIESDSITLSFAGTGKPLVIRGVSDASFTYLVMPLNR